jgi:hypothetical protein
MQGAKKEPEGRKRRAVLRRRALLASLVVFAGCSSAFRSPSTTEDGGAPTAEDSGLAMVPDEGTGLEGGALEDGPSVPQNLVALHAAPGLPPFRLCFATALPERVIAMLSMPPVPDTTSASPAFPSIGTYPAVPSGTPGLFPGAVAALPLASDFSQSSVRPFVVLASSLTSETADGGPDGGTEDTCEVLLGRHGLGPIDVPTPGRLTPGVDFWQLPTFSAGAFASGGTYLLSITGCLRGGDGVAVGSPADGGDGGDAGDAGDAGNHEGGDGDGDLADAPDDDSDTAQDASADATLPGSTDAGAITDAGGSPEDAAAPPSSSACGAGYDGGVNVTMGIASLDTRSLGDAGTLGVQFAHRAGALELPELPGDASVHAPATNGVSPAFFHVVAASSGVVYAPKLFVLDDGGAFEEMFSASGIEPSRAFAADVNLDDPSLAFGVVVAPIDASAPRYTAYPAGDVIALPLPSIASLSSLSAPPDASPGGFVAGDSYTFLLVGDPAEPPAFLANLDGGILPVANRAYDGRGLHLVAFPNVFSPPSP